ncbi:MAG: hypothetical protein KDH15_21615 [Rhodocyclaceae bacterium]|nr:hypothetical protein [Rhodocyclaceae bacterium]
MNDKGSTKPGEAEDLESFPSCRYGHGPLTKMHESVVLPVQPPWQVKDIYSEIGDSDDPASRLVDPPHLRIEVHYCTSCTYMELHYAK